MKLFGGIESGGTKFVCMVGTGPNHLIKEERFPTTTPRETIDRATEVFLPYVKNGELAAVGIASFGPLDLDLNSPTYGYITTTPKAGWSQIDLCDIKKIYTLFPFYGESNECRLLPLLSHDFIAIAGRLRLPAAYL